MRLFFILFTVLLGTTTVTANQSVVLFKGDYHIKPDYFGTHFHRLVLKRGEKGVVTHWPSARISSVRLWDSGVAWFDITPQAGQWVFDRMDHYVNTSLQQGASVLYTLGATPRWASARPDEKCGYGFGCGAEPVRMAHWEEYVRRIAERYKGRIFDYELWNEPKFMDFARDKKQRDEGVSLFFSGDVANMIEMARIARKVLDEVSPNARLFTPGFVNGSDRLDLFLRKGGKQYIQGIAYHFYDDRVSDSKFFISQLAEVREVMRQNGVDHLPLWDTESGVEVGGAAKFDEVTAAFKMAQQVILSTQGGIERHYYYTWDNDRTGMVTRFGDVRFKYAVYKRLQDWLIGVNTKGCVMYSGAIFKCEAERDGAYYKYLWSERDVGEFRLPLSYGQKISGIESIAGEAVSWVEQKDGSIKFSLGREPVRVFQKR